MKKNQKKEILVIGANSKIAKFLIDYYKSRNIIVWSTTRNKREISQKKIYLNL